MDLTQRRYVIITSFYEAFPPQTAYRLAQKYEMNYTPKRGSWLNIAGTELSALTMQCLGNRRIHSLEELNGIISDWEKDRNKKEVMCLAYLLRHEWFVMRLSGIRKFLSRIRLIRKS